MSEDNKARGPSEPEAGHEFRAVPDGYRQGLITAITVLLGFSLSFLRFWGFEAPGQWTLRSVISTGTTMAAIVLQLIALFRSLRLEDQDRNRISKDGPVVHRFRNCALARVDLFDCRIRITRPEMTNLYLATFDLCKRRLAMGLRFLLIGLAVFATNVLNVKPVQ